MVKSHRVRWPTYRFFIKTLILVVAVRLGLWVTSFRKMRSWVKKLAQPPAGVTPSGWPSPRQIALAVYTTSRYVPRASCLTQALSTQVLLGRYGHPSNLRIGVARDERGQFRAHAWVESDGQVVIGGTEDSLQQYVAFPTLDGEHK